MYGEVSVATTTTPFSLFNDAYCMCRGIGTNRPEAQLRQDLTTWLQTLTPKEGAVPPSSLSKLQENVQNRRFAMVALNVAKEVKTSDFASTYRHILK